MGKSQPQNKSSHHPDLITTNEGLAALLSEFETASFLAIDTEFMREHTYYAQLCLVQISNGERAAAIDPLAAGIDLQPLWDLLVRTDIVKVFHAAHQDLEIFLKEIGALPVPLFDSQIAAMVLGHGDQIGYDRLVRAVLNRYRQDVALYRLVAAPAQRPTAQLCT